VSPVSPVDGTRSALIVASDNYSDPGLRQLRAPASDAAALEAVLSNPAIGGFQTRTLLNRPADEINLGVEEFFADRRPDDLLLVHFSCHGVKDQDGELYFAAANTQLRWLGATAVAADFVNRRMNRSRSRRVVLLLDCCYAGAFERGMTARAGTEVGIETQFGGRGRAVITASSAMEYAFEGNELTDTNLLSPSVFTSALVEGLATGEADRDQDGLVALDELYDYVYDRVRTATPNQTPSKWTFGVQGDLYIARRSRPVTTPAPLPPELQQLIDHPVPAARAGVVHELARLLQSRHAGLALGARLALEQLTEDDSRMVAAAATAALGEQAGPAPPPEPVPSQPAPPEPVPPRLALSAMVVDFGRLLQQKRSPERKVRLGNAGGGILNAKATTQASWLRLRHMGDELIIGVDTTVVGEYDGTVSVDSDGGSAMIRVAASVDPRPIPVPLSPTKASDQPTTAGQTTTGSTLGGRSWPSPPPPAAVGGQPQQRQRSSPELGGDSPGYYQGNRLGTWWQRVGAGVLDLLCILVPSILLAVIVSSAGSESLGNVVGNVVSLVIWLYNRCYLGGTIGQSWGKQALHLKLVRMTDKQAIGPGWAFVRDLTHALDILTIGIGYLVPIWDARRQTLADKVIKTVVIAQDKTSSGSSPTSQLSLRPEGESGSSKAS
jgi:uncharacterized RDD family membrane protein YckC